MMQALFYYLKESNDHSLVKSSRFHFQLEHIHPFIDGNKRTAYVCMRLFLTLNVMDLTADPREKIQVMMALSAGRLNFEELAAWVAAKSGAISRR